MNLLTLYFFSCSSKQTKIIFFEISIGKLPIDHSNNVFPFTVIMYFGFAIPSILNLLPSPAIGIIIVGCLNSISFDNSSLDVNWIPRSSTYMSAYGFPNINSSYGTCHFCNQSSVILPTFSITFTTSPSHVLMCLPV